MSEQNETMAPVEGGEQSSGQAETKGRHRRTMTGVVVSTASQKTAVVAVTRVYLHPKYRKYVRMRKKYMAHDEHGACAVGDQVVIEECRPMSARKRWRYKATLRKKEA